MWSKLFVLLALVNLSFAGSACSQFPYDDLLFLAGYPPAQQFCAAHYPQQTTTITKRGLKVKGREVWITKFVKNKRATSATTTSMSPSSSTASVAVAANYKKTSTTTPSSKTTPKTTPTTSSKSTPTTTSKTTPTTTNTCDGTCSVWSSCSKVGGGFLSTLCGCIEGTKTVVSLLPCRLRNPTFPSNRLLKMLILLSIADKDDFDSQRLYRRLTPTR